MPAWMHVSTNTSQQRGASSEGLMTTPLPARRAGNTFHAGMATGKFHGVMRPTTPMGWRDVHASLLASSEGTVSPQAARPWPATKPAMSTASCTSPPASTSTLPASQLTRRASSCLRPARAAAQAPMRSARAGTGTRAHARWASAAAATAASTSAAVCTGRVATTSAGRAGLTESKVAMHPPFGTGASERSFQVVR